MRGTATAALHAGGPAVHRGRMRVVVNGEPREVPEGATVTELLNALGLGEVRVAVERNRHVVPRAQHPTVRLADGETVEIVHFVGGG